MPSSFWPWDSDCNVGQDDRGSCNCETHSSSAGTDEFRRDGADGHLYRRVGDRGGRGGRDFIAGAAEQLVLQGAKDNDIVLVEGQGSLIHPDIRASPSPACTAPVPTR